MSALKAGESTAFLLVVGGGGLVEAMVCGRLYWPGGGRVESY
jgi:hypothetical protein